MQCIWMALLYVLSSILSFGGIVGFSYVIVSALKFVMTCESRRGPMDHHGNYSCDTDYGLALLIL